MTANGFLFLLIAGLMTAVGNLLLRHGATTLPPFQFNLVFLTQVLQNAYFVGGVFLYGAALLPWMNVIAKNDLSISYPMLVGLTFLLVTGGAFYFFDEGFSFQKILGILIIATGILLVAKS